MSTVIMILGVVIVFCSILFSIWLIPIRGVTIEGQLVLTLMVVGAALMVTAMALEY